MVPGFQKPRVNNNEGPFQAIENRRPQNYMPGQVDPFEALDREPSLAAYAALKRRVYKCSVQGVLGEAGFLFTIENVSYVVGLRQLSIVFAVLMGGSC